MQHFLYTSGGGSGALEEAGSSERAMAVTFLWFPLIGRSIVHAPLDNAILQRLICSARGGGPKMLPVERVGGYGECNEFLSRGMALALVAIDFLGTIRRCPTDRDRVGETGRHPLGFLLQGVLMQLIVSGGTLGWK